MTVCSECGAPLDPDTIHIQHTDTVCDGDWGPRGCDCPEVCADCCTDPGCALREPQETTDG